MATGNSFSENIFQAIIPNDDANANPRKTFENLLNFTIKHNKANPKIII